VTSRFEERQASGLRRSVSGTVCILLPVEALLAHLDIVPLAQRLFECDAGAVLGAVAK
jgi:hypothetical protein